MISLIKATGESEPFSEEKVIQSIKRARIPENIQADTLAHIKSKLYDGISTEEIYRHILEHLETEGYPYAKAKYRLKEAIMSLGPSGYPFEDYVARLLQTQGYETQVRQILSGKCVTHEIDIIATKNGKTAIIETKFHNSPGSRSDVQTALYTQARFQDVRERNAVNEVWLVTNTKATTDAITYGQCMNMQVMSWGYPTGKSLRDLVEETRLFPITALTSLSQANKMELLQKSIILCIEIKHNPSLLDILPLSRNEREKVLAEIAVICSQ